MSFFLDYLKLIKLLSRILNESGDLDFFGCIIDGKLKVKQKNILQNVKFYTTKLSKIFLKASHTQKVYKFIGNMTKKLSCDL